MTQENTLTLQLITGMTEEEIKTHFVEFPPVWEEDDKPLELLILPVVNQIQNAHYLRKFIAHRWNPKLNRHCPIPTERTQYAVSIEATEMWAGPLLCPPSIIEPAKTAGWIVMAGQVPGILAIGVDQFQALSDSLQEDSEEEEDDEEEGEVQEDPEARLKEVKKEIKFLFGHWIPFPQTLIDFVDPEQARFNKAAQVARQNGSLTLNVNFAEFHFEDEDYEEPADYQIVEDR